jgi:hypothetical protein
MAAPSQTGAELVLEQQAHVLDRLKVPEAEREEKVALQEQIHEAVLNGESWTGVPPEELYTGM